MGATKALSLRLIDRNWLQIIERGGSLYLLIDPSLARIEGCSIRAALGTVCLCESSIDFAASHELWFVHQ
jgi:hypothetical protein